MTVFLKLKIVFFKSSDAVVDCQVGIRHGSESWYQCNEMMKRATRQLDATVIMHYSTPDRTEMLFSFSYFEVKLRKNGL